MKNDLPPETRQPLDELIAAVPEADDPHGLACSVMGCLSDAMETSLLASRLYLLWADLTDFYELRSDQRASALVLITDVARRWHQRASAEEIPDAELDRWEALVAAAVRSAGKPPLPVALTSWHLPQRQILVSFDPAANAVYVTLDEARDGFGPTEVTDAGVIVDTDAHEHIRGLEFLAGSRAGATDRRVPRIHPSDARTLRGVGSAQQ